MTSAVAIVFLICLVVGLALITHPEGAIAFLICLIVGVALITHPEVIVTLTQRLFKMKAGGNKRDQKNSHPKDQADVERKPNL